MSDKDYYEILGVSENASEKQIKDAYRRLAFQVHPDRNRDPASSGKMRAINEAYAVLSNGNKRKDYDTVKRQFGSAAYDRFRSTYTENDIFRGSDINRIFEEMAAAFGFRSFDDVFKQAYGEGYRSFEFKRPGFSAKGFVFTGGARKNLNTQTGRPPFLAKMLSRYLLRKYAGVDLLERGADVTETIELTPQQARDGGPYAFFYRKNSKKLVVNVPPRLREGQRIRLAGMGEDGKGRGSPGDLYLKVKIRKPLFERMKGILSSLKNQIHLLRP